MIDQTKKAEIIKDYMTHEGDTGSPEVQVAILTFRINDLNEHLKIHKERPSFEKRTSQNGRTEKKSSELP